MPIIIMSHECSKFEIVEYPRKLRKCGLWLIQMGYWSAIIGVFIEIQFVDLPYGLLFMVLMFLVAGGLIDYFVFKKTLSRDQFVEIDWNGLRSSVSNSSEQPYAIELSRGWASDEFYTLPFPNYYPFTLKSGVHCLRVQNIKGEAYQLLHIRIKTKECKTQIRTILQTLNSVSKKKAAE